MRRKSLKTLVVLTALSLSLMSYQANAQGPQNNQKGSGHRMRKEMMGKVIEDLGLTQEQQESMKTYRSQNQERIKGLHEKLRQAHQALKAELEKEKSSNKVIKDIATSLNNVQAEMVDNRIDSVLKMKEVLSPEQFKQFTEKIEEHRKKTKESKQRRRGQSNNKGESPWER